MRSPDPTRTAGRRSPALAFLILSLATPLAYPQIAPDAGTLERQLREDVIRERPQLKPHPPAQMPPERKGARVTVKQFRIQGATLVGEAELLGLLSDLIGTSVTFAELEQAAQRIAERYRKDGWLVRVYLPLQDVTDGEVSILVVEARYGGARLENRGRRLDEGFVKKVAVGKLVEGEHLSAATLERGLLLSNELSGVKATGVLEAGEQPGETVVRLVTEDTPLLTADLGIDNQGARSTGRWRARAGAALNGLTGRGDRLSITALASPHLVYGRAGWSVPIGSDGLRAGVNLSQLDYELAGDFSALDSEGSSTTWNIEAAYPIRRSTNDNLRLALSTELRKYEDDSLGAPLHRKTVKAVNVTLSGDKAHEASRSTFHYALTLTGGELDLSEVAADFAQDQAGPRADGGFAKLAVVGGMTRYLADPWSIRVNGSVQFAGKNLDSSEKFSLGGPQGVRAYPGNEATGDEGWLLSAELHRFFGDGLDGFAFLDAGGIRTTKSPWPGSRNSASPPNEYQLAAGGIGLNWSRGRDFALQLTFAVPLGSNRGTSDDDRNQDGSRRGPRAWLTLTKFF